MSKITLEINDTLNEYWVVEAIKFLKAHYTKEQLKEYIDGSKDIFEVVEAMYKSDEMDVVIMTTEELKQSCKNAVEQGNWNSAMYRAFALDTDDRDYYKAKFWAYNGNPVAIRRTEMIKILKKSL